VSDPAPPPSSTEPLAAGTRADGGTTGEALAGLSGPLCLVLLAGLAMPPHHGLMLPLGLLVAMVVVGERRRRRLMEIGSALAAGAGHPLARRALQIAALASGAVLLTVLARGVGALAVDVPASLWGAGAALAAALVWALVGRRVPGRARALVLVTLAAAVPLAGVVGTRHEAEGPHARGFAHSGPILGIHPFQTTAILIDGHGPFDLPINDYVEPDGGRGYGPATLADALDRALASVADRVYPHGPARIRRALVDAEVEAVVTPGVWERLDRPPTEETQPRFVVRSGSFGRGSRVEFVCPGRRIDPRGPQGETVMNRMCPDKYASEASAGLGVTGRWSGYSEARGQDRVGLHQALRLTRSDDAEGRRALERETRIWAWLLLAGVALLLARPAARVGEGLRGVGGALGAAAVTILVLAAAAGLGEPAVGVLPPAGPSWSAGLGLRTLVDWAPALALGAFGLFALGSVGPVGDAPASTDDAVAPGRVALAVPAILVVVATVALATALPALAWIVPVQGAEGAQLTVFVRGVAEAIGERAGLTIFEVEGAVASTVVGVLLGGAVATAGAGVAALDRLSPRPAPPLVRTLALAAVLVVAAFLVVSRKTAGAAALVPGVVGITLVLGSGLGRLVPTQEIGPWLGRGAHLGWTALGAALVWAAVEPLPSHPFVTLCTVLGLGVVLAAGLAGVWVGRRPGPDSRA
jgi:hypothetical protein